MGKVEKHSKRLDEFSDTMTDIFKACFTDNHGHSFHNKEAIDFFFYLVKYDKSNDYLGLSDYSSDRNALVRTLLAKSGSHDTPVISTIYDFLLLHLLKSDDACFRNVQYQGFRQKTLAELIEYCKATLGISIEQIKDIQGITSDFVIDIITICFLIGRHGISVKPQPLSHELYVSSCPSNCLTLIKKVQKKFTVIYGNANERISRFMPKYIMNQMNDISHRTDYKSYISGAFFEEAKTWLSPKYKESSSVLLPGVLNTYLLHSKDHYFIIYDIPTQEALCELCSECRLSRNVILVCDYDVRAIKEGEDVSYLPFDKLYKEPEARDIHDFLENYGISDDDNNFSNILYSVSNKNLYLLHAMELLIKNIKDNEKSLDEFKLFLNSIKLSGKIKTYTGKKYTMVGGGNMDRNGNYLSGHIRRLYKSFLSVDEQLFTLLLALHNEKGLSEKWISQFLSPKAYDILSGLMEKGLAYKMGNTYYYGDSIFIPYVFLDGGKPHDDEKDAIFNDAFFFLNSLLREVCYQNSNTLEYSILQATIKATITALFSILQKTDYDNSHFSEIWYYHIRYTRFFLENGDMAAITEIRDYFEELADKYTKRPGKEYKQWKKIYSIYIEFLNLCLQPTVGVSSWMPYTQLIEQFCSQLKKNHENIDQAAYYKIILSLLEMIISYLSHICVSAIHNSRITQPDLEAVYIGKMAELASQVKGLFVLKKVKDDSLFFSELEASLNTIIQLSDIYSRFHNRAYIDSFICPDAVFTKPRYEQLNWLRINCALLTEQCYTGYASSDIGKISQASYLQCLITDIYQKLTWVPLDALEDYYHALIMYVAFISPESKSHLLSYIDKDLKRYDHIWESSVALEKIKHMITTESKPDNVE